MNLIIFAHLLGILTALGFPPFGIWPLTWLSGAGIIWLFLKLSSPDDRKQLALSFASYSFSVLIYGFYWLTYTMHEFGNMPWVVAGLVFVLVSLILSLISFGFGYFWHRFLKVKPQKIPVILWLGLWLIFFEILDLRLFPWVHAQSVGSDTYLLSTVTLLDTPVWSLIFLSFILILGYWAHKTESLNRFFVLKTVLLFVVFFAPLYTLGFYQKSHYEKKFSQRQPIALLQGNVGNYEKKLTKLGVDPTVRNVMAIHRDLVEEAAIYFSENLDEEGYGAEPWIIWPETSFPGFPTHDVRAAQALRSFVLLTRGLHIVGAYEEGEITLGGQPKKVDYNIAALFHEAEGYVGRYRKRIRMPFGEYIPFDQSFPQAYQWLPAVNHFGAGESYESLPHPDPEGPVFLPLICYEILFRSFVDEFVKEAQAQYPGREIVLVNPTNDSWYGPTSEPFTHSLLARWSAARQGLPLLRPTNTGLSQIVAPWGEVLSTGPRDESWVILGELPMRRLQPRMVPN